MSTPGRINFELRNEQEKLWIKDFPLADATLSDPTNAVALYDGEWLTINSSGQCLRPTVIGTPGNEPGNNSFILLPCFAERGRTDVMAMSRKAMPLIWMGEFEADTRIYDATATVTSGLAITAIGQPRKLATVAIGSRNFCGIVGSAYNETGAKWVGYVTKLPANNGTKLRFRSGYRR